MICKWWTKNNKKTICTPIITWCKKKYQGFQRFCKAFWIWDPIRLGRLMRCFFNSLCSSFSTAKSAFIISNWCSRIPILSSALLRFSKISMWWVYSCEESRYVRAGVSVSGKGGASTGVLVSSKSNGWLWEGKSHVGWTWWMEMVECVERKNYKWRLSTLQRRWVWVVLE